MPDYNSRIIRKYDLFRDYRVDGEELAISDHNDNTKRRLRQFGPGDVTE